MSSYPKLIQFWMMERKMMGLPCEIMDFHHWIAEDITKLVLGILGKPNLMILMPPRCCKTDLGIKAAIPWSKSYFPDSEDILASYGSELATDNSIACRSILSSNWYRSMVDDEWGAKVKMSGEKAGGRQDHFLTLQGGSVKAVGRGGGITGFGAGKLREEFGGMIVMDDMLKANEKDSPAARRDAVNYYLGTLKSRRNRQDSPPTPMMLIMQRLHPEDLAGYILREEREDWHVLQIPAHEGDKVIWPGRLNLQTLLTMAEADEETYNAQYMQNPSQSMSVIFRESWWKYWRDRLKAESKITLKFITGDTAFKAKDSNDYSVFQCWGCIGTSGIMLLDQLRGKWEFPDLLKNAKEFWLKHSTFQRGYTQATEFWIEDKASGISLIQTLQINGLPVMAWEPDDGTSPDKVGRAKQCTFPLAAGRVAIPDASIPEYRWVKTFVNEHNAFSNDDSHLFDDQVDAETMAILIWLSRGGGTGQIPTWDF